MNWEAIGAIGQVFGSIAVFITLVYLSVQTNHSRRESQRAMALARNQTERDLFARGNDTAVRAALRKANRGLAFHTYSNAFIDRLIREAKLTEEEAFMVFTNEWSWWSYRASAISHYDELPPNDRAELSRQIHDVYGSPGLARTFYEDFGKSLGDTRAVLFIENSISMRRTE